MDCPFCGSLNAKKLSAFLCMCPACDTYFNLNTLIDLPRTRFHQPLITDR